MIVSKLGIPENFEEKLPNLREKSLKWETIYNSRSEMNSAAKITFYQALGDKSFGNIVLIPGLATNNEIDPLMTSVTFWGLTHKYNIVNIDTFANDFLNEPDYEKLKFNTYQEFKTIIHQTLKFVYSCNPNSYHITVGHCASSNGIIDTFNDCVKQSLPIPTQSALLFAPFAKSPGKFYEDNVRRLLNTEIKNVEKHNDPVSKIKLAHMRFLETMENFRKEVEDVSFEPELMTKWSIPVTFVTAQRDKLSTFERIDEYTQILKENSNNFKHLHLKNKQHSFATLCSDTNAIIDIIRSQRRQIKR